MGKSGSRRGGLAPLLGDRWRKKPLSGVALLGGVEAGVVWMSSGEEEMGGVRSWELGGVRSLLELIKFSSPK